MSAISDLVEKFYGNDPIAGEDACLELLKNWRDDSIDALIPLDSGGYSESYQVELRLKYVTSILGNSILPHLVRVISSGPWRSKVKAAICFSGLKDSDETEAPLIKILEAARNFDAERNAIDALGRLGAYRWAPALDRYAKLGAWRTNFDDDDDDTLISDHAFHKLSSYVLEAFTRFTALSVDPAHAHRMFRELTDLIELRETRLRNRTPNSYDLVIRLSHEFAEWSVDALIEHWGGSENEHLQRLCMDVFRDIAPLQAANFLLQTAISPAKSDSVRRGASLALGEIRLPQVAQRLAEALKSPDVDRKHLGWAFSTLYAVPADWSGLSSYVDEVLTGDVSQACQLRYSLALKGDHRCRNDLINGLDDSSPFVRWASALALARLLGPKARTDVEQRAEAAELPFERAAMYAAMVRAGDHEKAEDLHDALQEATDAVQVLSVWKLEVVDAFRNVETFDHRAFSLWRQATRVGARQFQYFEALAPVPPTSVSRTVEASATPIRTKIFISYSHADDKWLNRLQIHLKPLQRSDKISLWSDKLIKSGDNWREVIQRALEETKVAILLISADFMASDFINTVELPALLAAAQTDGVVILPIVISPSRFDETESLSRYQSVNLSSRPILEMSKANRERVFVEVSKRVDEVFRE